MNKHERLEPLTIWSWLHSFSDDRFRQQSIYRNAVATSDYHFVDKWRVEGGINEVAEIIEDAAGLTRWWPSVYFDYEELEPGGEHGVGKLIRLHAGGWLPYTLWINFRTLESNYPHGFTLEATGDLAGTGIWIFEQDGPYVNITYDWTIRANKSIIRNLSFLLKPIFRANHVWTMRRGEESLKLELRRRHAHTPDEAARIPAPPRASFFLRRQTLATPIKK